MKGYGGPNLPVYLAEHKIHCTNNSNGVGNEMVSHHEVCTGEVSETRSANATPVWAVLNHQKRGILPSHP